MLPESGHCFSFATGDPDVGIVRQEGLDCKTLLKDSTSQRENEGRENEGTPIHIHSEGSFLSWRGKTPEECYGLRETNQRTV
jgi:hypothetical protein